MEPIGQSKGPGAAFTPQILAAGARIAGRFQIDTSLDVSLFGQRYLGSDTDGTAVCITVLEPLLLAAIAMPELDRAVAMAVAIDHKNIAHTFGLFSHTSRQPLHCLVTESVPGQTLADLIEKKRAAGASISLKGSYNIVAHLCNALGHLHSVGPYGLIHPQSVLIQSDTGRIKLAGSGVARVIGLSDRFRHSHPDTVVWLAPEVRTGGKVDLRSDFYSLGVLLFQMLSGRLPKGGERLQQAGVPPAFSEVIARCMSDDPKQRFPSAAAVKQALQVASNDSQEAQVVSGSSGVPGILASAAPLRATLPVSGHKGAVMTSDRSQAVTEPLLPRAAQLKVSATLSALDDASEHWLIHRGKVDFGPYAMREVRAQIETGKISGEDLIIDSESGDRRKVKDHPQLRQLVTESAIRLAEADHYESQRKASSQHKRHVVWALSAIAAAVVLFGGGGLFYVTQYLKPRTEKVIVHEVSNEADFLKDIRIELTVDKPLPKARGLKRVRSSGSTGNANDFDAPTNLGDANEEGGDETLDRNVVQRVMHDNFKVLTGCLLEEHRRDSNLRSINMDFIVKGSGVVSAVKVNGQTTTPLASCMYGKMQSVMFPKFNGQKTHATFSMSLR